MIKADHPKALLHGSLVSPSLGAAIINGKYVNAVPLYRLEQEFQRYGLQITRQNMANWCIRLAEEYLSLLYDYLHKELYSYHVIQADETPVLVNRDGRKAGSKSRMWVCRSGHLYQEQQIVLYEYQQTRNASHPREFLKEIKLLLSSNRINDLRQTEIIFREKLQKKPAGLLISLFVQIITDNICFSVEQHKSFLEQIDTIELPNTMVENLMSYYSMLAVVSAYLSESALSSEVANEIAERYLADHTHYKRNRTKN